MPTEIQTTSDVILLVRQVSRGADRSYPAGTTHALGENFYRKARGGAYVWRRDRLGWAYMEDTSARHAMRRARKLNDGA